MFYNKSKRKFISLCFIPQKRAALADSCKVVSIHLKSLAEKSKQT